MSSAGKPSTLNIAFAGTPDFAVPPLKGMISHGYVPTVVLTQPDRRAGRGRALRASPVKEVAADAGLEIWQPGRLSDSAIQERLRSLQLDLVVVVAYGLIFPRPVLATPRYGCWNIHASLLPRWRGAAPIQRAIEAGDEQTGVSIMQMAAGLDTGPVYLQKTTPIARNETGGSLHDRLAELGGSALLECLDHLSSGDMPAPLAQDHELASYASKLDKAEARIDWNETAEVLERRIRAFNPWPVCWFELGERRIRVWDARTVVGPNNSRLAAGAVVSAGAEGIVFRTGEGYLCLTEVQAAGGRRMPAAEYLNAHPVPVDG